MITRALTLALLVAGASALSPTPAVAQTAEAPTFESYVADALEHYKNRRYPEAIVAFEKAYELRAEPELVYNIARSYEKSLKRAEAIAAYERFLGLPGTTAELRASALSAQDALRKEQETLRRRDQQKATAATATPEPKLDAQPATTARATVAPEAPSRTLEWVLIGGGLTVAAAGGVFTGLAFRSHADFEAATDRSAQIELRDETNRNALVADVLVGAGAVSVAVGLALFLFTGDTPADVALAPTVGSDGAGLTFAGRF
ncbi:hypothetical protein L6R52_37580 [Myxococcota bacterium]|nr:hypothetical protein [Myxococcota bacterium]